MKRWSLIIITAFSLNFSAAQNRFYDSTKQLLSLATTDSERLILLDTLGGSLQVFSYPDTGLKYAAQEVSLTQKLKNPSWQARALQNYAWCCVTLGRYAEALAYTIQADNLAELENDDTLVAYGQMIFSEIYRDVGDFNQARFHSLKLLHLAEESGHCRYLNDCRIITYLVQAMTYEKFDNLDSALHFGKKAYDISVAINGYCNYGLLNSELGAIYSKMGKYGQALKYYYEGISLSIKHNILKDVMTGYNGMARTFVKMNRIDSAIYYSHLTFITGNRCQYRLGMVEAAKLLGDIYRSQNNIDSSLKYMQLFVALKDSTFSNQKLADIENLSFNEKMMRQALASEQQEKISNLRTWSLLGIVVILLLTTVLLVRNESLRRKNERLKFEKTNAKLRQEANELEMQALRSQMNPHFIFNCLNAINRFIVKNETQDASDYLTKFSRLMRMVLNHSKEPLITLDDELSMLRLYLDLEQLRFKSSFDFTISHAPEMDTTSIYIPPLLFQPFVENAIWHGLLHKKEKGHLLINLELENDVLKCTIIDNGIGRARALELRSKSAELRKSMGIEITRNRLALVNKNRGSESSVEIIDLVDEEGTPTGTKVVLSIYCQFVAPDVQNHELLLESKKEIFS